MNGKGTRTTSPNAYVASEGIESGMSLERVVYCVGVVIPYSGETGYSSLSGGLCQRTIFFTGAQKIHEVGHFRQACRRQLQNFFNQLMFGGVHGNLPVGDGEIIRKQL